MTDTPTPTLTPVPTPTAPAPVVLSQEQAMARVRISAKCGVELLMASTTRAPTAHMEALLTLRGILKQISDGTLVVVPATAIRQAEEPVESQE